MFGPKVILATSLASYEISHLLARKKRKKCNGNQIKKLQKKTGTPRQVAGGQHYPYEIFPKSY